MKKIDLHTHTISTASDVFFDFDIDKLKEYIESREIDCISITNHNLFDLDQFKDICENFDIKILPGIEINLEKGHILIIADGKELTDFAAKCSDIATQIDTPEHNVSVEELKRIFPDLSKYIVIPHYDKNPSIKEDALLSLGEFITAGEVASPKKFMYCIKDNKSLVPVYFSDIRLCKETTEFSTRQSYIAAEDVSFRAIKMCLSDKTKVFLSKEEGHHFFDALDNGLKLSSGLNVVLGERSSGKTYTLDSIKASFGSNVKYIKQFDLVVRGDDEAEFEKLLTKRQSLFTEEYLKELQNAVDSISNVYLEKNDRSIEMYLDSILKNAKESEKADSFSEAQLFTETKFPEYDSDSIKELIGSVTTLIENAKYRGIIDNYISVDNLKKLAVELIGKFKDEFETNLKKGWLNDLVVSIKNSLNMRTAAPVIEEIEFYQIALDKKKIEKFCELVNISKTEREIFRKEIQGFQMVAKSGKFDGAGELKKKSGKKMRFSDAFKHYNDPYKYLIELRNISELEEADYFKYFIKIEYNILNKDGYNVSGGERSEFRLLQKISDAQNFDMLLIDEPESSFDNLFLKNEVNELIKDISKSVPVVLVTHNNTVGASIKPDYVLYTKKSRNGEDVKYDVYSGYPSDKYLMSLDGKKIKNFDVMMNCLEAGTESYIDRRKNTYEVLKD